ncbi:MAG: efflux RND transporter permease subunit [Phycisphaerae bacterium]
MTQEKHAFTLAIVNKFLNSNLSIILIILSLVAGGVALWITPREEDPQIVVPLADVFVNFPGHSAKEVEQLVAVPLEKLLFQIDGVEHVYSMSREGQAVVTVRFYVGQDRERSLIKLYNKVFQNTDAIPPGVTGWVIKPVEIDDVPIVSFTLTSKTNSDYHLRRVAEEISNRLAVIPEISRLSIVGGQSRQVKVYLSPDRMAAYSIDPVQIEQAIQGANVTVQAGSFDHNNKNILVDAGRAFVSPEELKNLVVGVHAGRPVFLKDVTTVEDGPSETIQYVRLGWGPAWNQPRKPESPGSLIGEKLKKADTVNAYPAVTIAVAKKKGTNAVWVSQAAIDEMGKLTREVVPDDVQVVITRNAGLTADEKVNDLVDALAVAIVIVVALLAIALGFRESMIVSVAVPIVFGLTLAVNLLSGYSINRVTLFALILSLGLLVDDPIVDVENIHRHFSLRKRSSKRIVLEAVNEVRPPLITATLAVIISFLPMMFITGMMGPYMRPMALNVPITMLMSMLVSFTVTPWMSYHVLRKMYPTEEGAAGGILQPLADPIIQAGETIKDSPLYRLFKPLMAPLMRSRRNAWLFMGVIALLMVLSVLLMAVRAVPLKMLPSDNKNELQLVMDFDEGTTLEQNDACVRKFEDFLRQVPEVTDFASYVGTASPMDFNGMVRHYYLRQGPNVSDIRINLVPKKNRVMQSHAIALRLRPGLEKIARECGVALKIVETPPGPPVIETLAAEVMGRPSDTYDDLIGAAKVVRARMEKEAGVADIDDTIEAPQEKIMFVTDKEKAQLNGITTGQIARTIQEALEGREAGTVRIPNERQPLVILLRLSREMRSSLDSLSQIYIRSGTSGRMVPILELGVWQKGIRDQTIYHKDMRAVVYVFADTAGRPPADVVLDIQADRVFGQDTQEYWKGKKLIRPQPIAKPVNNRTFLSNGGNIPWYLPADYTVRFSGEGEWQITIDVFRDMGLAYVAALLGIYILLVNQTGSFGLPGVIMLAIPLTIIGIMPGFWLLNKLTGQTIAGYSDPVFFTATAMIGMIALAGIVTRDAIILVDFIHLSLARGRSLFDAIMESRVIRLRPILLTAGAAMLGALPIALDPIFSGLAWSLIFGLFASTVFTLFVIPVAYWLIYEKTPGHGLPPGL